MGKVSILVSILCLKAVCADSSENLLQSHNVTYSSLYLYLCTKYNAYELVRANATDLLINSSGVYQINFYLLDVSDIQ